jgi:hypothetical protein
MQKMEDLWIIGILTILAMLFVLYLICYNLAERDYQLMECKDREDEWR